MAILGVGRKDRQAQEEGAKRLVTLRKKSLKEEAKKVEKEEKNEE